MKLVYGNISLKMDMFLKLTLFLLSVTTGYAIFETAVKELNVMARNVETDYDMNTNDQDYYFGNVFPSSDAEENGEAERSVRSANVPCTCKHDVEKDHLVAYYGNKLLRYLDEVNIGSEIKFHCRRPGYHRLFGRATAKCQNDCSWDPPEVPSCLLPQGTDIIIEFKADPALGIKVGPGGVLLATPRTKLTLSCKTRSTDNRKLHWKTPLSLDTEGIETTENDLNEDMREIVLIVSEMQHHYNGNYTCFASNRISHTVSIYVTGNDVKITVRAQPAENLRVLAGGVYAVVSGTHLSMECQISDGYVTQLEWKVPKNDTGSLKEDGCVDRRTSCNHLKYQRRCTTSRIWSTKICRKTCGACDSDHPFKVIYDIDQVQSLASGEYACTDRNRLSAHNFHHSVTIKVIESSSVGTGASEVSESTTKTYSTDSVTNDSTDNHSAFTEATGNGSLHNNHSNRIEVTSTDTISVCSCHYIALDSVLIGYDGNRKLTPMDEVQSGSTVTFHCANPGHFVLRGNKYVTCPPECIWHSSWFPSCIQLTGNDVIITVRADPVEELSALAGGVYKVIPGTRLNIECQISEGYITQLEWKVPINAEGNLSEGECVDESTNCYQLAYEGRCTDSRVWSRRNCRRTCGACNSDYPYKVIFTIDQVSSLASGEYTCIDKQLLSAHNSNHSVSIEVKDAQCPEIPETENLIVIYERNRDVNTKAYFQCSEEYTRSGPSYVTCEPAGQWSAVAATCSHTQCPEIAETENLIVAYERNRDVNTKAYFSCNEAYARVGPSHVTCEPTGQWSAVAATCSLTLISDAKCPEIPETENLIVSYKRYRDKNTKAYFHCHEPHRRSGPRYVICESTGQWSEAPATCSHAQCPEIAETENLIVAYERNRDVNTKAYFSCSEAYARLGPSHVTCEPTGQWSAVAATCSLSKCSVTEIYDALPEGIENVVPYTEGIDEEYVPYGYSLNLLCEKGFILKGNNTAVCNKDGKWTVDKTGRCIKGCRRIQTKDDSKLLIYPEKEFFEIGESIALFCAERKVLTNDVRRIMCFTDGWTPKNIPDCQ